jgi:ketosteroid isomerase-like protein
MKTMNLKRSVVMIAVMFTAIITYSQQSEADYRAKIEKLNKEMVKHMLDQDLEKHVSMYTADAISLPSNEPMKEGVDAIRKAAEESMKSGMKIESFDLTTKKVIPDGNLITEIGTYKMKLTMPGMDQPMEDHGKYLTIWEKQKDGSLKVKVETWNSDVNPMDLHQMEKKQTDKK